jgi:hypothetical protein
MRTRSGRMYFGDIEVSRLEMLKMIERKKRQEEREQERVYDEFLNWKSSINTAFYNRTSCDLDDIPDLPYYDYFTMGISSDIVLAMALNNML